MGYAREMAKKFEKVERQLNEMMIVIQGQLADVEDELKSDYNTLSTGGEAEGMLKWKYDTCLDIWQSKYQSVITRMNSGLNSLRIRKTAAGQLKEYWTMKAEMEEAMERAEF